MTIRFRSPSSLFVSTLVITGGLFALWPTLKHWKNHLPVPSVESVENTDALAKLNWLKLHDPKTGQIPAGIRNRELAFAERSELNSQSSFRSAFAPLGNALNWKSVGPPNVGGRSRQIVIDSTNHATLLVAAAQGGVWRSTDRGMSWNPTTAPDQLHDATCIVQDPHPGKQSIWYYGTGELLSTTFRRASVVSSPRWRTTEYGNGIYRSTNGGVTWLPLTSTISASSTVLDNPFDGVWSLVINPTSGSDVLYAACYGGIMRSTDYGSTWKRVLGDSVNCSFCTDIVTSSSGVLYAALSQKTLGATDAVSRGIWRSTDGLTWKQITPANWPALSRRMKLALAPSNQDVLYVLMETPGIGRSDHSFWKHTFLASDPSPTMGTWEDRSNRVPIDTTGQNTFAFNSLGGYALTLAVKPTNEDIVFIGGTNLYRSNDGMKTDLGLHAVGGYTQPTLHPDQHTVAFDPDDPNAMYVGNDGGVFFTDDNRDSIPWQTLNNNYVSTLFVAVALDHTANNDDTYLGGLQDNGSWAGGSTSLNWGNLGGGDGCYCAIADGARHAYTSSQFGYITRFDFDGSGNVTGNSPLPPDNATSSFTFVTPWMLDPNNNNILYMAATNAIVRNDAATGNAPWVRLPNTVLPDSLTIGSIALSKSQPNLLYYGTNNGRLFQLADANVNGSKPMEVTGPNFPKAYISCIAIDPHDAKSLLVVFSNYGVQSLFASTDGGVHWHNASGTLEEHPDGSGDGPSCRWASIMHVDSSIVYLVGTSTGLYSTWVAPDSLTQWHKEGVGTIGNITVEMIDTRETDHLVAIATQGRGIFSTTIASAVANNPVLVSADQLLPVYPSPASSNAVLPVELTNTELIDISIVDITGREVRKVFSGMLSQGTHQIPLALSSLPTGSYFCLAKTATGIKTERMVIER